MSTVAIVGTFDTKGVEFAYAKKRFEDMGVDTLTVHCGSFEPQFTPDIGNAEVARAAGVDITEMVAKKDRGLATKTMTRGVAELLPRLFAEGRFDGVFSMGGSGGTTIATAGMRRLPIGVPKVMVSTMAAGDTTPYIGASDISMFPSIVDVAGVNELSRRIFDNATAAMAGMLAHESAPSDDGKPLIAASMFGVTTPAVQKAKRMLEDNGYEVLVFHATGTGGKCMEKLVDEGFFAGVLDLTTTEWADQVVGGVLAAGDTRCGAAARNGVPAVVSVGACDMVNFGPRDTVPDQFSGRTLYQHNPNVTLMRTTADENRAIARGIARQVNQSTGPCEVLLPRRGVSMIDAEGQPFYGAEADRALFDELEADVDPARAKVREVDAHVNDDEFVEEAVRALLSMLRK